ncbi:MAG TPA: 4-hydroxy-3-methylbut-2-enyl diphosphate reductase [Chitinispirillaceae bacterium]|nr:4-hydroxy-3-methylbut-2-enyl diphosphate reductase [Chitinispirillaceae bacterium]
MKIIIAKTAGFCMGVKRAVDIALENSSKNPDGISTIGPLIHNNQTLQMLQQRGVTTLKDGEEPAGNETLLIRAHGIPPQLQQKYVQTGHPIIDGTCPKVKTVHKVIERFKVQGYTIIITGDEGHAEVIGLLGYAGEAGHLVQSVKDVDKLPRFDKVCLVSQTTFDRVLFDQIAETVKKIYPDNQSVIKKTICSATDQRQLEIQQLSHHVDAMIVVGGKNSANTQRLAKIARDSGIPTQHIETEKELDWKAISKCTTLGITAGASTPNWMIKRVIDYIQYLNQTQGKGLKSLFFHYLDAITNLNVFVALGAVALYFVSCYHQELSFQPRGMLLSFLYFLSMYLWNSVTSFEHTAHHGLWRFTFYQKHKKKLYYLSGACICAVLCISWLHSQHLFYLMLFASLAGSAYYITIFPKWFKQFFSYRTLKDIPSSRDLFVALAWATVLTFMPQALSNKFILQPITVAVFIWIFILAFLRSLVFDLRDIEGDRILGRETLITIVGEKRARKSIYLIIIASFLMLLIAPGLKSITTYTGTTSLRFLLQMPVLMYIFYFVKWNPKLRDRHSAIFNLMADGMFYLSGFGALVSLVLFG